MNLFQSNRRRAIRMARVGIAVHIIADRMGLAVPELETLYGRIMRAAFVKSNLRVWETLLRMATSGIHPSATIFWLRSRAGAMLAYPPRMPKKQAEEEQYAKNPPPSDYLGVMGPDGQVSY